MFGPNIYLKTPKTFNILKLTLCRSALARDAILDKKYVLPPIPHISVNYNSTNHALKPLYWMADGFVNLVMRPFSKIETLASDVLVYRNQTWDGKHPYWTYSGLKSVVSLMGCRA